jgi:hypothetical protein
MRVTASLAGLAVLATAACGGGASEGPAGRSGAPRAETACVEAVNDTYGRAVALVVSSGQTDGGTRVVLNADGNAWHCLATDAGDVRELALGDWD